MSDLPKVGVDRTGILERYEQAMGIKVEPEAAPVVADANLDNANPVSKSDAPPEGEHTDAAPKEPAAKAVVVDPGVKPEVEKPQGAKTVPVEALHEEREKRKAKTLEARQLQEQLSAKDQELSDVKSRLAAVEETIRRAKAGESVDEPTDDATKTLVEENKRLKDAQAKDAQERLQKTKDDAAKETSRLISESDVRLAAEGYPGFQEFGADVYKAIVAKIKSGDLEEKDVTTDLWAKVYKEEVFPAKKAIFEAQVKQDKLDAKTKMKKAGNLANNPGEGPTPKEEEDLDAPQTPASYLKMRKRMF